MTIDSRIIDKIRKLLALAGNNPSEAESTAAFARAQELATRHRIELASIETEAENPDDVMTHETIDGGTKSHPGWRKVLMGGVFHSCGVFVVLCGDGRYTLAGKRGDIDTAKYLYAAIANEIERLAKVNAQGQGRAYANAYRVAAAATVSRRLREQHEATVSQARQAGASETALARVERARPDAEAWYRRETGARLTSGGSVRSSSRAGHAAGQRDGQSINIGGNTAIGRGRLALGAGR
jgi:hypothetical protein